MSDPPWIVEGRARMGPPYPERPEMTLEFRTVGRQHEMRSWFWEPEGAEEGWRPFGNASLSQRLRWRVQEWFRSWGGVR
jgi:hypothetical protein